LRKTLEDGKIPHVRVLTMLPTLLYRFKEIPIKIPKIFFTEIEKVSKSSDKSTKDLE
jgi:hypothetical protein